MTRLRAGRDEDGPGIIALVAGCWAEYPGCVMDLDGEVPELRALASYYTRQGGRLWAAEEGGRVAGIVGTRPLDEGAWEVCKMYVAMSQRGTGLAGELLAAAEGYARTAGGHEMKLWSDTRFERAHRFYEHHGYLREGPLRVLGDLSNSLEFAYAKPLTGLVVRRLDAAAAASAARGLARLLAECVAAGGALEFLPPLGGDVADAWWQARIADIALSRRVLLAGWIEGVLAGVVMLRLESAPDQPHIAEVQKLMVAPTLRRRGVARQLMRAAEVEARAAGRSLLLLSSRAGDATEALYRALGWQEYGRIAGFALNIHGRLEDEVLLLKRLD